MQMQGLTHWIENTALSEAIRDASWVVPTVQSVHICAIAVVVGSALITELRLAGAMATDEAAATVVRRYLPWMWRALLVLLVSGVVLIWGEPERTLFSWVFWLKMGLVFVGYVFSLLFRRPLLESPPSAVSAWSIKPVAYLSLAIWIAVVCSGRWIAYTE